MLNDLVLAGSSAVGAAVIVGGGWGALRLRRRSAPLRRPEPEVAPEPDGRVSPAPGVAPPATAGVAQAPPADAGAAPDAPPAEAPLADDQVAAPAPTAPALTPTPVPQATEAPAAPVTEAPAPERPRLRDRLGKARSLFGGYLGAVRSRDRIDESTWEALEEALILADVGAESTAGLLEDLRRQVRADGVSSPEELVARLRDDLVARLQADRSLALEEGVTNVWLMVGVNGVGKTTTIGKLAQRECAEGRSVVVAAGDTFRAAAADQLATWAERAGAELVRGNEGGDPGAVIFDAVQHAAAKGADLVLADTAGRLHNKVNLMEELKKVRRVAERPPGKVTEALLVLDATTGQNGLTQAKQFAAAVGVTGVVLTKLDGTAKGGIALAVQTELGIPVKLVGIGESATDLVEFDPVEFVDALVAPEV